MKICQSTLLVALATGLWLAAGAHAAPRTSGNPSADGKSQLSEAQFAEVQARAELANEIARNVSADAQAKGLEDSWRINLLSSLYNTPSGALRDIRAVAKTLSEAHTQAAEARSRAATAPAGRTSSGEAVAAGLGSSTDSLVFTPIAPCRYIDTRYVGGPVGASPRQFEATLDGSAYGGSASCSLPAGPAAIAANVTIANPSIAGYLTVRPAGSTDTTSWLNWYQAGQVVANAGIIGTRQSPSSLPIAFEVLTGGGTANVILDYFGYFSPVYTQELFCRNGPDQFFPLPAGFSGAKVTLTKCPSGTTATAPICLNVAKGIYLLGSDMDTNGQSMFCFWDNQTGRDITVTQKARCCAVP